MSGALSERLGVAQGCGDSPHTTAATRSPLQNIPTHRRPCRRSSRPHLPLPRLHQHPTLLAKTARAATPGPIVITIL